MINHPTVPYILVGVRHGIIWRCWLEPGESEASWQRRADEMREAMLRGEL